MLAEATPAYLLLLDCNTFLVVWTFCGSSICFSSSEETVLVRFSAILRCILTARPCDFVISFLVDVQYWAAHALADSTRYCSTRVHAHWPCPCHRQPIGTLETSESSNMSRICKYEQICSVINGWPGLVEPYGLATLLTGSKSHSAMHASSWLGFARQRQSAASNPWLASGLACGGHVLVWFLRALSMRRRM